MYNLIMAQWNKIDKRGRVDDRRSFGKNTAGIGITGIVVLMGITYFMGGNPLDVLQQVDPAELLQQQSTSNEDFSQYEGADEYETFIATVLGSNNYFWEQEFQNLNKNYSDPEVVLFRGATQSECGGANALSGPHYCPIDETIYIDETFFEELQSKFGAQGGDVAEAYVLGHEVGHHVQNELGFLKNNDPISIELTADCFSGMWAGSLKNEGIFEKGEIIEALDAAAAVGDDRIQQKTTGRIDPESWTHGSSEERVGAFNIGYETTSFQQCSNYLNT